MTRVPQNILPHYSFPSLTQMPPPRQALYHSQGQRASQSNAQKNRCGPRLPRAPMGGYF